MKTVIEPFRIKVVEPIAMTMPEQRSCAMQEADCNLFNRVGMPFTSTPVISRRTYTQSHIDYVVEAILEVHADRDNLRGMRIIEQPPVLRHFAAGFEEMLAER